ncbi:MAG: SUMF1/EgtB/PvdO family nonheme iron enzyme [Candidatus Ozemobacteraceae bacterium]
MEVPLKMARNYLLRILLVLFLGILLHNLFRENETRAPRTKSRDFSINIPFSSPIKMLFVKGRSSYSFGGPFFDFKNLFSLEAVSSHLYQPRKLQSIPIADFFLSEAEISNGQFQSVCSLKTPGYSDDYPLSRIDFDDIQKFCSGVSSLSGKKVRLPLEQEWEYACRCGLDTKYDFDPDKETLWEYANIPMPSEPHSEKLLPIKSKKPNCWGFYDLFGNVQEVAIPFDKNPHDWSDLKKKAVVLCGGSFQGIPVKSPTDCWMTPLENSIDATGFRIAMDVTEIASLSDGSIPTFQLPTTK